MKERIRYRRYMLKKYGISFKTGAKTFFGLLHAGRRALYLYKTGKGERCIG